MKFVKIEKIVDHEEMIINIDDISLLIKNKKFKMGFSHTPPYDYVERKQIEGEFEYLVLMKNNYHFYISKENYEFIKSKTGV